jgi:PAS domain S-box-containing protein
MAKRPTYEELEQRVKALEDTLLTLANDERKSEAIIEAIGDGISIIDTDFKILYENKVHRDILGDHQGENCYVAYQNNDQVCEGCHAEATFRDGQIHTRERSVRTEKGVSYFEVTVSPVRNSKGKITEAVVVVRDITERKRAEEAMRIKDNAIESSINGFAFAEFGGNLTYVNKAFLRLWGYNTDRDVLGRPAYEFWQEPEKALEVVELLRAGGTWVGELVAKKSDGSAFDVQVSASMIVDETGNPTHMMGSFLDITKRKLAEEALQAKELELEIKAKNLEEVNTALRVLLKQREGDKAELEEKVLSNVKDLVLPYVERLKKTSLGNNQMSFVDILESNLKDIISPFSRKLSSKYLGLTPTEIRVANLIKDEKTTKDIAEFMNLSEKTVETHRTHIRRKIGIKHKKVNLKTYLSSLQ